MVIDDGDGWGVRLDGVEVVSFTGPHAREWAVCEREELAQLLDAQSHGGSSDRHYRAHSFLAVALAACRIAGDCTALLLGVLGATRDHGAVMHPLGDSDEGRLKRGVRGVQ